MLNFKKKTEKETAPFRMKFVLNKRTIWIVSLVLVLALSLVFVLKFIIDNRVSFARLSPTNTIVSTEQLNRDIATILSLYDLEKNRSELLLSEGNYIYDTYYKKDGTNGRAIFINVNPNGFASSRHYTEIETLMEIWLYVIERQFSYDIDGITYCFTATGLNNIFAPLSPNEIHMSRTEFLSLYNELNIENLSHHKKVEKLTNMYLEKTNYKRKPSHVQVK